MGQSATGQHVFLSYASEDRQTAAAIGRAIERHGFTVWWDVDIPTGVHYPEFIEKALKSAGCVVVLWSKHSVGSRWVRNEADWGVENSILVPVLIDDSEIPWEFRNVQTLDLSSWSGDGDDPALARLIESLKGHVPSTGRPPEKSRIRDTQVVARRPAARGPRKPVARRPWILPAVIIAVVAALAVAAALRWNLFDTRPQEIHTDLEHTPITGNGLSRSSAISPDGKYLAYTPMPGGESGLYLKQIDTGSESVLIPIGEYGIRSPVFSPDGTEIYFAMTGPTFSMASNAEYDLYRISMLGGQPVRITERIIGRRFAVSPDGTMLAYKRADRDSVRVFLADAGGDGERTIASEHQSLSVDCCIAWAPDEDALVTTTRDAVSGGLSLIELPLDGADAATGTQSWQKVLDLHRLADGSGLLVVGSPVTEESALNLNLWFLTSVGREPRQVTNDITNYYQVSGSTSGHRLALTYYVYSTVLRVLDVSEGTYRDLLTDVVANRKAAWAGGGHLVASQRVGSRVGLVAVDARTGITTLIPTDVDYVSELDVSPDGGQVVFTSFSTSPEGSSYALWQVPIEGGAPRRLPADEGHERGARFSPDGLWLAAMYREAAGEPWMVRRRALDGGAVETLADVSGWYPRISPDGREVAAYFSDAESGQHQLGLVPSGGGAPRFLDLPGAYRMLEWSSDGSALTCYRRDGTTMLIENVPLDGGDPSHLTDMRGASLAVTDADWSSSGDSLALCLESRSFDVTLVQGFEKAIRGGR